MSRNRNSIDDYLEDAPTSEVRLNYEGNPGMVSNLGMISTIGVPMPLGTASNLGMISRLHRNSFTYN